MPFIEFPSSDGTTIIQAQVEEALEGGCELRGCVSRPNERPELDGMVHQEGHASNFQAQKHPNQESPKATGPDDGFNLSKANKFLRAWALMMKQGAVSEEVYEYRKGVCGGVPGVNSACPHLADNGMGEKYCNQCGCGNRKYATLFIEGQPASSTERLWMPDPQCPILAIRPIEGTGSLKSVGGRIKQLGRLIQAGKDELKRKKLDHKQGSAFLSELEGEANGNADMA